MLEPDVANHRGCEEGDASECSGPLLERIHSMLRQKQEEKSRSQVQIDLAIPLEKSEAS